MTIIVTAQEASALGSALDGYIYWCLSDQHYRNSGYVIDPGSDDAETAEEIADYQAAADWCSTVKRTKRLPESMRDMALTAANFYIDDPDECFEDEEDLRPALESLIERLSPASEGG